MKQVHSLLLISAVAINFIYAYCGFFNLIPKESSVIMQHTHSLKMGNACPSPSFVNRGAVFVFFHLAKAGGSTIRYLFQSKFVNATTLERTTPEVADSTVRRWLSNATQQQTLFVEYHNNGNPSVEKLAGQLKDWRKMAALHNKPLFVFTVIREPTSYALSYFTYQNVLHGSRYERYSHWEDTRRKASLTLQDLMDFTLPSPQCLFYSRGEAATTNLFPIFGSKWNPTVECPQVYQTMLEHMDWVGTLETMQDQMIPLLTYLSSNNPEIGREIEKKNENKHSNLNAFVNQVKANQTILAALSAKLEADQWLYTQVQKDFQWESWWSGCIPKSNNT